MIKNRFDIQVVAVDYDGTLTIENAYPAVGVPNPRAIDIMKRFRSMGGKVILWTLRTDKYLADALAAMKAFGLEFDGVNNNLPERQDMWRRAYPNCTFSNKVFADLYIDDRAPDAILHGINWDEIEKMLLVPVRF